MEILHRLIPDAANIYTDKSDGVWALNAESIIPYLVNAIQKLNEKNETLQKIIDKNDDVAQQQNNKIRELEKKLDEITRYLKQTSQK